MEFMFMDAYPHDDEEHPEGEDVITNHRYDAGWPRDDSEGCIVGEDTPRPFGGSARCGKPEDEHRLSEYPSQRPDRNEGVGHRFPDVGAMHEPKPYTGELDWPEDWHERHNLVHPFVD